MTEIVNGAPYIREIRGEDYRIEIFLYTTVLAIYCNVYQDVSERNVFGNIIWQVSTLPLKFFCEYIDISVK